MLLPVIFALNTLWFGMGFHAFYLKRQIFGKVLVPQKSDRENSAYAALVESGRFMGGFNIALCLFNLMLVFNVGQFETASQWATLLLFNSLAHGSQFLGNVPMALRNREGQGLWSVFKGIMLRIFVIDFVLMTVNLVMAITLVLA